MRPARGPLAILAAVLLAACAAPTRTAEVWTAGIVERDAGGAGVATLTAVATGRHPGFDRFVLTFSEWVPGYHLEYVDRPVRACGSGEVVPLAGDAWLEVRLEPARAHDDEGAPTVAARRLRPGLPIVLEAALTCDFEAVVTWVLGVGSPQRYRVIELADPPRLVVDLRR